MLQRLRALRSTSPVRPRALAALLALAGLMVGCGAPTLITGKVTDETGLPVKGVVIETQPETDPTLTNGDGWFVIRGVVGESGEVSGLSAGTYVLTARRLPDLEAPPVKIEARGKTVVNLVVKARTAEVGDTAPTPVVETPVDPGHRRAISSGQ